MSLRNSKTKKLLSMLLALCCACFTASFCLNNLTANADENVLPTTALVTEVNNATVASAQTKGSYSGLLISPKSATETWSATINSLFTGDTSVTYLLPNQSVNNMANGFTVRDSKGNFVMSIVLVSRHWSYCQGGIYAYNGTKYTRPIFTWDDTSGTNYWKTPSEPTAITNIETILKYDFYIAPKHGVTTTGPHNYYSKSYNLATAEGTLYFNYDNETQNFVVSTTTYDVEGFDSANGLRDDMLGAGTTVVVGSRNYDLSEGYTITLNNVGSFGTQDDDNFVDLSTSSAVLITDINGVNMSTETVSSTTGSVVDLKYANEVVKNGKNYISSNEGELLGKFDVYANFNVGDLTSLTSSVVGSTYYSNDNFNVATPGEYDITVEYGGFSKDYTVIVNQIYKQPSANLITSTTNATVTASMSSGEITGLQIGRTNANSNVFFGNIIGNFTGNSSITFNYVGRKQDAHSFNIYNSNNQLVASVVNYYSNIWQKVGANSYLYDVINNKYTAPTSTGFKEITLLPGFHDTAVVKLSPAADGANFSGWEIETKLATIYFEYSSNVLTVKQSDVYGSVYTLGVVENVDLSNGYTIGLGSCDNLLSGEGVRDWPYQFTETSRPILITEINGTNVAGDTTTAIIGEISEIAMSGATFDLSSDVVSERKIYLPQYSTFTGGSVKAYNEYSENWVEYLSIDGATIGGDYDANTCGNYNVKIQSINNGAVYSREVTLIVEPSRKIELNANNGESFAPIYISNHYLTKQLPTPIKYGWAFDGWFTESGNQVTELTSYTESMTLIAKWSDSVKPVISLNGLSDYEVVEFKSNFSISALDVIAEDEACGFLTGDQVQIYVKAPSANDFISLSSFVFEKTEGEYLIKYVAIDVAGNTAEITRTIKYMPIRPVIVVDGEYITQTYLYDEITILPSSATSGDIALTTNVSVSANGSPVSIVDGKFVANVVGEYTIVYSTQNENDLVAIKSYTINVIADTVEPVITVEFTITEISKGETLVIPVATATDNCDGELPVQVKILKGETVIATDTTVINEEGVFAVIYIATDNAGNVATMQFEVFVKGEAPKPDGCSSSLATSSMLISLIGFVGSALIVKRKKK